MVLLKTLRNLILYAGAFGFVAVAAGIALGLWVLTQIPSTQKIKGCMTTQFRQVHLCPGSKNYTPLAKISEKLQVTVVQTEDSRFWQHQGFDFFELKQSFEKNLEEGRMARGGSTISQQLAKNLFLTGEKSLSRKAVEALYTLRIEQVLQKKEILERYLNVVEWGEGIYGVQAASKFYFSTTPQQLNWMQSAFLAFLLPNPKGYSVSFRKKKLTPFAKKRILQILDLHLDVGRLSTEEHQQAIRDLNTFLPSADVEKSDSSDVSEEEIQGDHYEDTENDRALEKSETQ